MENLHAERNALGILLAYPQASYALDILNAEDFSNPAFRFIFESIKATSGDNVPPTLAAIIPRIRDQIIDGKPIAKSIVLISNEIEDPETMPSHIRSLKEFSGRRQMQSLGEILQTAGGSVISSILPVNEEVISKLDKINASLRHTHTTAHTVDELASQMIERLKSGSTYDLIDTGLMDLNREIGGFSRNEVTVIAGRPGMGKTAATISMLRQSAQKSGHASMYFSMEMPGSAITARLLSDAVFNSQTPIQYKRIIRSQIEPHEIDRLENIRNQIGSLPMMIDDHGSLTVSEIGVRARRYQDQLEKQGMELDAIAVDHIGFIRPTTNYKGQRALEVGEITRSLKELAKSLGVALLALCQLNRDLEKREDRRPQLSDLRASGEIEEHADTVLFPFRRSYYLERVEYQDMEKEHKRLAELEIWSRIMELIGAKTRNGQAFVRKFFVDMGNNCIRDMRS